MVSWPCTYASSVLEFRPGFELGAFFVTWIAVALLALVAAGLHARLRRLEHGSAPAKQPAAFAHLFGKPLEELMNGSAPRPTPRIVLFLSSSCDACARMLKELSESHWAWRTAVAWVDDKPPSTARELPADVALIPDGPSLGARLGIRVTPFALVASDDGTVVRASPVNNLGGLHDALGAATGASRLEAVAGRLPGSSARGRSVGR